MTLTVEPVREEASQRYFHLRDVRWADSGNGKDYTFEGKAAIYNSWSEPLWTPRGMFRERIRPGAFADVLARNPDVRLLQNHNKDLVLARTKAGTLDIQETDDDLRVWARVARTSYATDLKLLMERGDIDGMSFMFETDYDKGADDHWYIDDETGEVRRDVLKTSDLIEVTIATFPAYAETEAVMREIRTREAKSKSQALFDGWSSAKEVRKAEDLPETPKVNTAERRFTPRQYSRCRQVVAETPWAIKPTYLDMILGILSERIEGLRLSDDEIRTRIGSQRSNEPTNEGSVAVVPLVGPIYSRAGAMSQVSAVKSLDIFREEFRTAVWDPTVKAILLDVDSPGGTADMIPEVAMEIRDARSQKPVVAIANAMAASAAYWLASAASEFVVTPSGEVGSIGVYTSHTDVSRQQEAEGRKTTIVKAGKYKAEMNAFEPLTDEARAKLQNDVDTIYKMFVKDVAKNRMTTMGDVIDNFGEGRTVMADEALKLGMVDSVETFEQVLARLQNAVGGEPTAKAKTASWGTPNTTTAATSANNSLNVTWTDNTTNTSEQDTTSFESRGSLRGELGLNLVAQDDPADDTSDAPPVVEEDSVAALKERSKAAMQRARDHKVRLTKKMLS